MALISTYFGLSDPQIELFGRRLSEVKQALADHGYRPPKAKVYSKKNRLAGWTLISIGNILTILMFIPLSIFLYDLGSGGNLFDELSNQIILLLFNSKSFVSEGVTTILFGVLMTSALLGSVFIRELGRRLLQPSAAELLQQDTRPPIVLLRSFADDGQFFPPISTGVATTASPGYQESLTRFEAEFARYLAPFGPLVAIGEPGEPIPQLGAARAYVDDTKWKAVVDDLIDRSGLVLMIAGDTPGVQWELKEVLQEDHWRKLILLMPPRNPSDLKIEAELEGRRQRWATVATCLPGFAEDKTIANDDIDDLIAAFFRPDKSMVLITDSSINQTGASYERAITLAVYGMFLHNWGESSSSRAKP